MAATPDLAAIARKYGTYAVEGYAFVGEGLRHSAKKLGRGQGQAGDRHLSAQELVEGVLDLAASRYGMLARMVLRSWGLRRSEDIGRVTFHLIDSNVFGKQDSDRIEDFNGGPDFDEVLDRLVRERLAGI